MLEWLCERPLIEKTRYHLTADGREWVVDEFEGENAGLIIAEVELEREGQAIALPEWVGREVTDEPRYLNVNLIRHPYRLWSSDERARRGPGHGAGGWSLQRTQGQKGPTVAKPGPARVLKS